LFGPPATVVVPGARAEQAMLERLRLFTTADVRLFHGELIQDHKGNRDIFRITVPVADGQERVLFLKRNWKAHHKNGLASLFRRGSVWSVSREEWENLRALQAVGVNTAGLLAYGEECGLFRERFSFLLTEAATGSETVEQFLRQCRDRRERRRVFDALAREVRRMHDAGLATPDMFTRHIFVNRSAEPPVFCWIDMARLDRARCLSPSQRARDLAALNITAPVRFVSARERLRFLRIYAGTVERALVGRIRCRTMHLLPRRKFRDFHAP
jgi:hypothetical protein